MPHEQTTLATGTLLRERYAVEKVLGSGSTGAVYLVKDVQRNHLQSPLFALKEISGLEQQARYRFSFSGVALRQLHHAGLPGIHHVFKDDKRGCIYLVTAYVEGSHLENLRREQPEGRFSWTELRPLVEPLVGVLTYLHDQEPPLVHGDIKPINVIENQQGNILLVDMGSAQVTLPERLQVQSNALASYQAPEAFSGNPGPPADIYSLGATLYALLTGKTPADAATRQREVHGQQPDPLPLASEIVPSIPRPLAQVLQQALALDPGKRFASVQAFWTALPTLPAQPGVVVSASSTPAADAFATSPIQEVVAAPAFSVPAADELRVLPDRRKKTRRPQHKALLSRKALLCTLLLLLLSTSVWAWVASSRHAAIPSTARHVTIPSIVRQGPTGTPPASERAQPTSQATVAETPPTPDYPSLSGVYNGALQPVFPPPTSGTTIPFTLHIQHQEQQKISGSFTASAYKNGRFQDDRLTGIVTLSGQVQFTVMNASGSALLAFNGRLTKSSSSSSPSGGNFHSCADEYGAICQASKGPLSGYWVVQQT